MAKSDYPKELAVKSETFHQHVPSLQISYHKREFYRLEQLKKKGARKSEFACSSMNTAKVSAYN